MLRPLSLRLQLILALMLAGLAVVVTVGGVAYLELQRKFSSRAAQQATAHFRAGVTSYLQAFGSFEAGEAQGVGLGDYLARQRGPEPLAPSSEDEDLRSRPPEGAPEPFGPPRRGVPPGPRPDHGRPPGPPPDGRLPPPGQGARWEPRPPQAPSAHPPFRFILTDAQYRVLLGAGSYPRGEPLPEAQRALAEPVQVEGKVRAYVSTEGVLSPGQDDLAYLAAMRQALMVGALAATVLAALLGLALGTGLSARLRRLTQAVRRMHAGELLQRVDARGSAEIEALALAFNRMSEALARSDAELRASHATISMQARQLKELSIRDALTGLYNRRHFDESVRQMFEQSRLQRQDLTLVLADIDWFKRINDQYSHAVGDEVLRRVAALLERQLGAAHLLARYGGEEFVMALPGTPLQEAAAVCEQLRASVAAQDWSELAPRLQVSLSMGLAADLAAPSASALLEQADAQLYRAKDAGRNRVCHA
ncbi:diguanylate cyclase [Roseateles sp. DB2]|uniref:GGDEF domain-containing protein n=1 Tax=Roseateles sp. DB2 TaxID=3453717 RepID=UPI003EEBFE60